MALPPEVNEAAREVQAEIDAEAGAIDVDADSATESGTDEEIPEAPKPPGS